MSDASDKRKSRAAAGLIALRDRIRAVFEEIEDEPRGPGGGDAAADSNRLGVRHRAPARR